MNYDEAHALLKSVDQIHVLAFWDQLDDHQQAQLLNDISQTDWPLISRLAQDRQETQARPEDKQLDTPPHIGGTEWALGDEAMQALQCGEQLLREGRAAVLTVAGGQGTRLGFDGPKGTFPLLPISNKTLFQHFAETILAINKRYNCTLPWYIMTSPDNHQATQDFFQAHSYFGLNRDNLRFFQQGTIPALSPDGQVLLAQRHRLALSPDGHGGTLRALRQSGALDQMLEKGIEYISYFQVDNPLIKPADPVFLGLVHQQQSDAGSKVVRKAYDEERVGVFVQVDGQLQIIEYSDMPEAMSKERLPDGTRRFDFANIAAHVFRTDFVDRLTRPNASITLPWHRAHKKVACVDLKTGQTIQPKSPNAIKLEQFIFDALPLAKNPIVYEVQRSDEFSPVKNADGADSPESARRDLMNLWRSWLRQAGLNVESDQPIEISPLFAINAEDIARKKAHITFTPSCSLHLSGPLSD